jgi:hypothetical protein
MNPRPILIALGCAILVVGTAYFVGKHAFKTEMSLHGLPRAGDASRTETDIEATNKPVDQPLKGDMDKPQRPRQYRGIEEILANASPEFRRKYAEMVANAQAYAEEEERKRLLNPSPEDIEDARLLEQIRKRRKEWEAEDIADAKKDTEVEALIREIEEGREEDARILEEAKQYQAESDQIIKELIEAYKRRGLWDYRCDTQVYNLYNDQP